MSVSDSKFSSVDSFEPTLSSSFVHSLSKVCKGWSTSEKSIFNRFAMISRPTADSSEFFVTCPINEGIDESLCLVSCAKTCKILICCIV